MGGFGVLGYTRSSRKWILPDLSMSGRTTAPISTPAPICMSTSTSTSGRGRAGPVTTYATVQACGIVNDHLAACFCRDA
jgi:3-methyladenine DNA glycosylase Tag